MASAVASAVGTWATGLHPGPQPGRGRLGLDERGITNLAVYGVDHLAHLIKQRLRACQNQTDLIAGFLAHTGITLEPEPT